MKDKLNCIIMLLTVLLIAVLIFIGYEYNKQNKTKITRQDAITRNNEKINVYTLIKDDGIYFYKDELGKNILENAKYTKNINNAIKYLNELDFTDLDNDGNSDLTAYFTLKDNTKAIFTWFWQSEEGFVLNEEFSQLPGESSAKGE